MFSGAGEVVKILDRFVKTNSLAGFLEVKCGLDLQGDRDEETGAAETTEGGHEEIVIHCPGTSDQCSVCQEQTEGEHMGGNHPIVDTRSVRCSCHHTREGLVRYRAEIGHSEALGAQFGVKFVESDTGLGDDKTFVSVDLFEGKRRERKKDGRKWAVSGRA